MNNKGKSLSKKYPSLALAYEQVKDVLVEQERTAHSLDTKVTALFAVASAIAGIGIPLALNLISVNVKLNIASVISGLLCIAFIGSYIRIIYLTFSAYHLQEFITMNNPEEIRKKLWHVVPSVFYHEILLNIEIAFHKNDEVLKRKANITNGLVRMVIAEAFASFALLLALYQ